jgi:hypothetical protein
MVVIKFSYLLVPLFPLGQIYRGIPFVIEVRSADAVPPATTTINNNSRIEYVLKALNFVSPCPP